MGEMEDKENGWECNGPTRRDDRREGGSDFMSRIRDAVEDEVRGRVDDEMRRAMERREDDIAREVERRVREFLEKQEKDRDASRQNQWCESWTNDLNKALWKHNEMYRPRPPQKMDRARSDDRHGDRHGDRNGGFCGPKHVLEARMSKTRHIDEQYSRNIHPAYL